MKKLFVCLLTLIVCFAVLVACGGEDTTAPATTSTPESTTEPSQGTTNTGLEDAKAYLVALYKDSGEATPVDYELIGALRVDGVSYTLEWSVGDVTGVTVTRKDATTVLIDVVDGPDADIPYTLTATITDADGNSIKAEFAKKVPKFKENTFAEYVEAENDALLIVKGVVSGIIAKSKGNTANCIYVQDTDGGYYVYGLENDPVTAGIEIGMTVRVTGKKDNYNGTYELKSASVEILNDGAKTDVVAKDLTDAFKAATDLKAKELIGIQGMYVTLKGVTIGRNRGLADRLTKLLEQFTVLSALNADAWRTKQFNMAFLQNTFFLELHRKIKTGLTADAGDNGIRTFVTKDLSNIFQRQRLHINLVRNRRIRHDRCRIGIHENDLVTLFLKSKTRLCSRIVKLCRLTDHNRA